MELSEFGDALRRLRKAAGMTQHDLAERIGVYSSAISAYEAAGVIPGPANLELLGQVFPELPLEELREKIRERQAERERRHKEAVARAVLARKAAATDRAAPDRPRRAHGRLTPAQELAAVAWAARQAGMSYGEFVARTPQEEYPQIYERFRRGLEARERTREIGAGKTEGEK